MKLKFNPKRNSEKKEKVAEFKDFPPVLKKRFNSLLALSIGTFIVGAAFIAMGFGSALAIMVMFWLTAISAALFSLKYRHDLVYKGFSTIEGTVTHKKEIFSVPTKIKKDASTRRPLYYHIKTNAGKIYRLDVTKGSEEIPLKASVRIYCPKNTHETENNGIIYLSAFWAFEIIAEAEPDDSDTEC